MITSHHNPKLKEIRRLQRRRDSRFVAEGEDERVALVARAGQPLRGRAAATIVVGAERTGLPDEVVAACERIAHIPIASESLNAAMAATIALYELTRP